VTDTDIMRRLSCLALKCAPEDIARARRREEEALRACAMESKEHPSTTRDHKALTPELITAIREARSAGATYMELGVRFGVSKGSVYNAIHQKH
jgi:hypothetical protein